VAAWGYPALNGFAAVLAGGVVLAGVVVAGQGPVRETEPTPS
jgi:hypothetical protein